MTFSKTTLSRMASTRTEVYVYLHFWGLHHQTFTLVVSNKFFTVTRSSVCHSQSLLPQSNVCKQGWSLPEWSPLGDSTSLDHKYYTWLEVTECDKTLNFFQKDVFTLAKFRAITPHNIVMQSQISKRKNRLLKFCLCSRYQRSS